MASKLSSMEFLPNELEMKHLQNNPLTELDESGKHYRLKPQRGCFLRCVDCDNLSQAESVELSNKWHFTNECLFCVQRVIDLLGWYEHGVIPQLIVSARPKTNEHEMGGIYAAIMASVEADLKEKDTEPDKPLVSEPYGDEPRSDVFDDCVGGD